MSRTRRFLGVTRWLFIGAACALALAEAPPVVYAHGGDTSLIHIRSPSTSTWSSTTDASSKSNVQRVRAVRGGRQ